MFQVEKNSGYGCLDHFLESMHTHLLDAFLSV